MMCGGERGQHPRFDALRDGPFLPVIARSVSPRSHYGQRYEERVAGLGKIMRRRARMALRMGSWEEDLRRTTGEDYLVRHFSLVLAVKVVECRAGGRGICGGGGFVRAGCGRAVAVKSIWVDDNNCGGVA